MSGISRVAALAFGALFVAGPAEADDRAPLAPGSSYVAMGSSFASGSGVLPYDPAAPARCQRSSENYARQLARMRELHLVDVTCGGATTAHILGRWNELPPQVDALTPDAALVTVTIGGNDLGYIGGLIADACSGNLPPDRTAQPFCQMIAAARRSGAAPSIETVTEDNWRKVETALTGIVREIRRRSPGARIIFVDYLTVLPEGEMCDQTPLSPRAAEIGRETASRLARLTADVAQRNGAEVLPASELSRMHGACADNAWVTGLTPASSTLSFVPYHPNVAGMRAVAQALDQHLSHRKP